MKEEIERSLREIGGDQLVRQWYRNYDRTSAICLPTTYLDRLAIGYALALGAIAASIDLIMDQVFRDEMAKVHRELTPEEQASFEATVKKRMKELGIIPDKQEVQESLKKHGINVDPTTLPDIGMDFYLGWLNNELGLKPGYKLRGKNHRILNHADIEKVIGMLMRGEVGIGDLVVQAYPTMSETVAREIFNLHIEADRHTPQSVPLKIMSWLWEQSIRSNNQEKVGAPNFLFDLLQKFTPNIEWKKWIEAFFGENGVNCFMQNEKWPKGITIGDIMLKLYNDKILNERVFWTSDLGASVGGFKRRVIIAATMEVGVEVFAIVEGISSGFLNWDGGTKEFISSYLEWRDQPKYLTMRTLAQATAAAGPAVRSLWKGDVLSQNIPSLAMTIRHLLVSSKVHRRHSDRLISFSRMDCEGAIEDFEIATGIPIKQKMELIEWSNRMEQTLDARLTGAGCVSTRVRVLASRYPDEMEDIVKRIEKLSQKVQGDDKMEESFDAICVTWYLSDFEDDKAAIRKLSSDVDRLESMVKG